MRTIAQPPETHIDVVVEVLHGQEVPDPYRWLEDADSPETVAWVEAQNAYTRSLLDEVPGQPAIRRRLEALLSIGVISAPAIRGDRYFFVRREGNQNQPILYVREGVDGEDRVLIDPNQMSEEGTIAIDWWYPSWDGSLLAYGYSANGDEWSTLFVLDVDTGELLPDRIERTRYASLAWLPNNKGFYYTRYPRPGDVPSGDENYNQKPFFHSLGTDPHTDPPVTGVELDAQDMIDLAISPNGRYLALLVMHGWDRSDLWLRDLETFNAPFVPVAVGHHALFYAELTDDRLFIHTNLDAPRYRLFRADPAHPAREQWEEIIPESDAVLDAVVPAGGKLITRYLRNATSSLAIFEADGRHHADVELPTLGSVTALSGRWDSRHAFFGFESFVTPPTVYELSLDGAISRWANIEAGINPHDYTVKQEWYASKDGTRVSIFIVHRRDLDRSKPHPTVLTGYGGFNISETPLFNRSRILFLERGGVFALPNLRGGAEYGEEWHRDGMLERKQNVFDDFIAAAEYLIDQGYTDTDHLAIMGGSNGGLLVGACLVQRPELYRAVVCAVPLLDMVRYHQFLIARLWIAEYGSSEDPEQFGYIYAYSPYHQVVDGTPYPAVLLTTAESDSRVDPLHARKMAARLQAATGSEQPILLRVEPRAGHGVGKPLTKLVDEATDTWSFLFWQLGIEAA